MVDQCFADGVQGLAHGFGFFVGICPLAQAVRGDLQDQVGEGAGLDLGEVELEGEHGGILLLIKYVINSYSLYSAWDWLLQWSGPEQGDGLQNPSFLYTSKLTCIEKRHFYTG